MMRSRRRLSAGSGSRATSTKSSWTTTTHIGLAPRVRPSTQFRKRACTRMHSGDRRKRPWLKAFSPRGECVLKLHAETVSDSGAGPFACVLLSQILGTWFETAERFLTSSLIATVQLSAQTHFPESPAVAACATPLSNMRGNCPRVTVPKRGASQGISSWITRSAGGTFVEAMQRTPRSCSRSHF